MNRLVSLLILPTAFFAQTAIGQMEQMKVFQPSGRILFQGDSITDGNRAARGRPKVLCAEQARDSTVRDHH